MKRISGSHGIRLPGARRPILSLVMVTIMSLTVLLLGANRSFASVVQIVDDFGQRITLSRPAMRIIALYGAYNDILGSMGLEYRLVART